MITSSDIHFLYESYFFNAKEENLLEDYFARSVTKEEWVRRLSERAQKLKELYTSNEELLGRYFYPLVHKEEPLSDEIVTAIAEELFDLYLCNSDYVLVTMAAELIEPYAEEHNMMFEHIIAICALGTVYQSIGVQEDIKLAFSYYMKLDKYRDRISEMSTDLLYRYYIGTIWQGTSLGNMEASLLSEVNELMIKNMNFWTKEKRILDYYDSINLKRAVGKIKLYSVFPLIAKVIRIFSPDGNEAAISEALSVYTPIY